MTTATLAGKQDWIEVARTVGPRFAADAARHDAENSFVAENYPVLRESGLLSALVPEELGGGGATHAEVASVIRELAQHCPATALALSMHQHLLAAAVWRYRRGQPGEALLRRVAAENLVLVSTGAGDWLSSSGQAERVEGGFRVTARKGFASGCEAGDLLLTSAPYLDPSDGPTVLHFAVPLSAPGVSIERDWMTLGMRGTGSHTVVMDGVLVAEGAVSLRRPRGKWHPSWAVIVTVAMPLIMAAYLGAAEAAAVFALEGARKRRDDPLVQLLAGELETDLAGARAAWSQSLALANGFDFEPTESVASAALTCKSLVARAVMAAGEKALELSGGSGFYARSGIERLLRDLHGAQFHPLPDKKQALFSGRVALGLDPAG